MMMIQPWRCEETDLEYGSRQSETKKPVKTLHWLLAKTQHRRAISILQLACLIRLVHSLDVYVQIHSPDPTAHECSVPLHFSRITGHSQLSAPTAPPLFQPEAQHQLSFRLCVASAGASRLASAPASTLKNLRFRTEFEPALPNRHANSEAVETLKIKAFTCGACVPLHIFFINSA